MGSGCSSAKAVQLSSQGTQATPPGSPPRSKTKSAAIGTSPYRDAATRSPDSGVSSGTLLAFSETQASDDDIGTESREAGTQTLSGPGGKILTARSAKKAEVPCVRQNAVSTKRERLSRESRETSLLQREKTAVSTTTRTRKKSPVRKTTTASKNTKTSQTRSKSPEKSKTPRAGNYSVFPPMESHDVKSSTKQRTKKYVAVEYDSPIDSLDSDQEFDTRDPENRPMSAVFGKFRSRASRDNPTPRSNSIRKTNSEPQPLSRMSSNKSTMDLSSGSSDEETHKTNLGMKGGKLTKKSPKQQKQSWTKQGKLNIVGKGAEIHARGQQRSTANTEGAFFVPLDKNEDTKSNVTKSKKKPSQAFFIGDDGECEMMGEDDGTWSSAFEDETGSEISMPDETQDKQYHRSGTFTLDSPTRTVQTPYIDSHIPTPAQKVEMALQDYQKTRDHTGLHDVRTAPQATNVRTEPRPKPRAQPDTLEATIDDITDAQEELVSLQDLLKCHLQQRYSASTMTSSDTQDLVRAYRAEIDRLQDQVIALQECLRDTTKERDHSNSRIQAMEHMTQTELEHRQEKETSDLERELAHQLNHHRQPISDRDLDELLSDHMQRRAAVRHQQLSEKQRLQDRLQEKLRQQVRQATKDEQLQEIIHEIANEEVLKRNHCFTQADIDDVIEAYQQQVKTIRNRQTFDKNKFKDQLKEKLASRMNREKGRRDLEGTATAATQVKTADTGAGTDDMLVLQVIQQTDSISKDFAEMDDKFVQTIQRATRDLDENDVQQLIRRHLADTEKLRKRKYADLMEHQEKLRKKVEQKKNVKVKCVDGKEDRMSEDIEIQTVLGELVKSDEELTRKFGEKTSGEELAKILAQYREQQQQLLEQRLLQKMRVDQGLKQKILQRRADPVIMEELSQMSQGVQTGMGTQCGEETTRKNIDENEVKELIEKHSKQMSDLRKHRNQEANEHRKKLMERLKTKPHPTMQDVKPTRADSAKTFQKKLMSFRRLDQERLRQSIDERRMSFSQQEEALKGSVTSISSSHHGEDEPLLEGAAALTSPAHHQLTEAVGDIGDDWSTDEDVEGDDWNPELQWAFNTHKSPKHKPSSPRYSHIDAKVAKLNMNRYKDLSSLVSALVQDCDSVLERTRAVYAFVTSQSLVSNCQVPQIQEFQQEKFSAAQLFTLIARTADVTCNTIKGVYKSSSYRPGDHIPSENHTWNIVEDDTGEHIIDTECAALRHIYSKEHYFCPKPEHFLVSHLPQDEKHQLCSHPVSTEDFLRTLKPWPILFHYGIRLIEPEQNGGVIRTSSPNVTIRLTVGDHMIDSRLEHVDGSISPDTLEDCIEQHTLNTVEEESFMVMLPQHGEYYFTVFIMDPVDDEECPACKYYINYSKS